MPYKSITFYVNSSPVSDFSECKYEQMGKNDPDEQCRHKRKQRIQAYKWLVDNETEEGTFPEALLISTEVSSEYITIHCPTIIPLQNL